MADLSSVYTIIGLDMLSGPATEAEAALDRLEERALRLGQETAFTAREAARGMEEMVKVGASLAAAVEASRTFEDEINEVLAKGLRDPEGKINAAIKAVIEKAERGPRRKKRRDGQ